MPVAAAAMVKNEFERESSADSVEEIRLVTDFGAGGMLPLTPAPGHARVASDATITERADTADEDYEPLTDDVDTDWIICSDWHAQ